MNTEKYLDTVVKIKIDRPLGSVHPEHKDLVYEVNYGFVPDTVSGDNEEIDCYLLGVDYPVREFTGQCIAVIKRLNDKDDKLIIAPRGVNFTDAEIEKAVHFQEKYFKHILVR